MSDNIRLVIEMPVEMFHEIRDTELISIETLNASIKAIENSVRLSDVLNDVKAEIEEYSSTIDRAISEDELKIEGMKEAYTDCLKIIDNISKEGGKI